MENKNTPKVIGIAIGESPEKENIFDIAYFDIPELDDGMLIKIEETKNKLGYFKNLVISHSADMKN